MKKYALWMIVVVCFATVGFAATRLPVTVSPGSAAGSLIGEACPTFSWGEVEGARNYDLVVYRLGEEGEEAQPVLRRSFTGSVSSWTPSLDSCLARGGRYAWSVRAAGRKTTSDWSSPSLFELASGPSEAEFEEALQVVRQYLVAQGGTETQEIAEGDLGPEPESRAEGSASSPVPTAVGATQLSVDGGIEATSFTGDGSSLTDLDPGNLSAGTADIDISGTASNVTGTVEVNQGGTGATTPETARGNLGTAASGANSDITSLAGLTTPLPISGGGTGASDAAQATTNLGAATQAGLTTHAGVADAHREHATLEESAEIDADVGTHAALPGVHHIKTVDTILTEPQVEGFVTNGPLDGSNLTNLSGTNVATGTVAEARIADEMARDVEVASLIAAEVEAERHCPGTVGSTDRYTDCGNGTIHDNNTGLIWLKDGSCEGLAGVDTAGRAVWATAEAAAAALADGTCGLTDGSSAGDWRQPTASELCSAWSGSVLNPCPAGAAVDSLINSSVGSSPYVSNTKGDAKWSEGDPFVGVGGSAYWSSTEYDSNSVWGATTEHATVQTYSKTASQARVWPVRAASGSYSDPATQAELDSHAGIADAHREHATLEESAEIDADIGTHAALPNVHHTPTVNTDTTCNGAACDGTNFTNLQWASLVSRPTGLDDGDDDTVGDLSCSNDDIPSFDGSSWVCLANIGRRGGTLNDHQWTMTTTGPGTVKTNSDSRSSHLLLNTGQVGTPNWSAVAYGNHAFTLASGDLVFRAVMSAYPGVDGLPRGLVAGTDRDNAIEFLSTAASSIRARTVSGGTATETVVAIGHSVGDWTTYEIVATSSEVRFYVDGNLIATHTTNIPTAALNPYFDAHYTGGGSVPLKVDWMSYERIVGGGRVLVLREDFDRG